MNHNCKMFCILTISYINILMFVLTYFKLPMSTELTPPSINISPLGKIVQAHSSLVDESSPIFTHLLQLG